MSAKDIRIVGILFGVAMLLVGFKAKRKWVKVLLLLLGVSQVAGNLLADDTVYEEVEARISEQTNQSEEPV